MSTPITREWLVQHAHLTLKEAGALTGRSESFMSKRYKEFGVKRERLSGRYVREKAQLPEFYLKRVPGTRTPVRAPEGGCRVCKARKRCARAVAAGRPVLCEEIVYGKKQEAI